MEGSPSGRTALQPASRNEPNAPNQSTSGTFQRVERIHRGSGNGAPPITAYGAPYCAPSPYGTAAPICAAAPPGAAGYGVYSPQPAYYNAHTAGFPQQGQFCTPMPYPSPGVYNAGVPIGPPPPAIDPNAQGAGSFGSQPSRVNMGSGPVHDDSEFLTEKSSIEIRHAFARKFTFGVATAFSLVPSMREWLLVNYWLCVMGMVMSFVFTLVVVCNPSLARSFPLNFVFLTLITAGFSILISFSAAATSSPAFFMAVGITAVVVIGLMFFACQVKYDFTGCGPFVLVALLVLLMFGLFTIFFHNDVMQVVYASLSAAVFSFMLVMDTQMVVGGKHRKYQYGVDDYIFGALTLYLDIINLFLAILELSNR